MSAVYSARREQSDQSSIKLVHLYLDIQIQIKLWNLHYYDCTCMRATICMEMTIL